jgi:virginiamycin B lyase
MSQSEFVLSPRTGLLLALLTVLAVRTSPAQTPLVTVTGYPFSGFYFTGITAGPGDGAVWFSGYGSNQRKIGRITADGVITEFVSFNTPSAITAGPDGALWFTEDAAHQIGRIDSGGVISEYGIPCCGEPSRIVAGPDGALWFTEGNKIGRITTGGVVTEYCLPDPNAAASGITAGPDGALWFTEPSAVTDYIDLICSGNDKIGRITTSGMITEYALSRSVACRGLTSIAAGPDGALWFNESYLNAVGRITTAGAVTEYPLPSPLQVSSDVTAGPDGALWFPAFNLETGGGTLERVTTDGVITEYNVAANTAGSLIVTGPDGTLWLTAYGGSIVRASVVNREPFGPAAFIKTDRFRDAANCLPYVGVAHRAICLW